MLVFFMSSGFLSSFMSEKYSDPNSPAFQSHRPMLLRSLFTVGLLCRHFDLDSEEYGLKDKEVSRLDESRSTGGESLSADVISGRRDWLLSVMSGCL